MRLPIAQFRPRQRYHGITFTEVMFAVIILGLGFIMVAGLFSVAGQQTLQNTEEAAGAAAAHTAAELLKQTADDPAWTTLVADGAYHPLPDAIWRRVQGEMISQRDPRYAWTAAYSWKAGEQFIHVAIIALQARNKDHFDVSDVIRPGSTDAALPNVMNLANLDPRFVTIAALQNIRVNGVDGIDLVRFAGVSAPELTPIASGAFLVIAGINNNNALVGCPEAGRIYRLGNQVPGRDDTWELVPGNDLQTDAETLPPLSGPRNILYLGLLVGKGHAIVQANDRNSGGPPYSGFAMDIAAYPTSILLKVPKVK